MAVGFAHVHDTVDLGKAAVLGSEAYLERALWRRGHMDGGSRHVQCFQGGWL